MDQQRQLTAIIEREGDAHVALCPELDIASQGDSVEAARMRSNGDASAGTRSRRKPTSARTVRRSAARNNSSFELTRSSYGIKFAPPISGA